MQPLSIDGRFEYSDAGFAGFNNPIGQAYLECQSLWGSQQAVAFVSLGTSLDTLTTGSERIHAFELNRPSDWDAAAFLQNQRKLSKIAERFSMIAGETRRVTQKSSQENDRQR